MKNIIEVFAPSGEEGALREILKKRFRGKFDDFIVDNMGNLIARSGEGKLCIECGMDNHGVMVVSKDGRGVCFAPVGELKVKDVIGRRVVFADGTSGEVCCDDEKDIDKTKISDLYLNMDENAVNIGDFGGFDAEFDDEECAYCAYGLKNRIGLAAVCKAIGNAGDIENTTILFSAQKRLGGRGIQAFFGENSFDRIVTIDGSDDDGCTVVAKDARAVSSRELRKVLEAMAEKHDILAETAVSEHNFNMEKISISCGDPCVAIGIGVTCAEGEKDRVSKFDFDMAVRLLTELLKGEA